jgi:hypothetical protein
VVLFGTHISVLFSLSLSLSCHANCLILRVVNVLSLAVRTFEEEGFFALCSTHRLSRQIQDKTEIFSLVHTNIVESGMTVKVLV